MKRKYLIWIIIAGSIALIIIGAYSTWNTLDPENTCARCHEVKPSHASWLNSAHADIQCIECHGTAFSDGLYSLREKIGMVYTHFMENKHNDDIHLSEKQVVELSNRCISCHRAEYAGWLASGHAVNYKEIFMDKAHNAGEKPYWDCLRCHGMFYEGNIHDLMMLDGQPHEWKIRDNKQETYPVIPCLACHRIHTENPVSKRYVGTLDSSIRAPERQTATSFYLRADKMYLRSNHLTEVPMMDGDRKVKTANDPNTLLCMQCHSPAYNRQAGSEDDRTPVGIHEGLSCTTCHKPHSGDVRGTCVQCHPSLTSNEIDTVYANPHGYRKRITMKFGKNL
jgi:hypothetical protein